MASEEQSHSLEKSEREGLARFLPSVDWLSGYSFGKAQSDGLVAIFVAALLVPQAMAYAQLAGLPPTVGLAAAVAPPIFYALFGTSQYLSIGPVALLSLLTATSVATAMDANGSSVLAVAALLALLVGLIQIIIGVARLGFLTNFISDPALTGFINGAALLIGASQLTTLLGIDNDNRGLFGALKGVWDNLDGIAPAAAMAGLVSLVAFILLPRFMGWLHGRLNWPANWRSLCMRSAPLLVVIVAIVLVWWLDLANRFALPVVGAIEPGLPSISLPDLQAVDWQLIAGDAVAIALLGYVISLGAANSLAGRNRQSISPDHEAVALGMGNAAAAVTGGYPVGASLSRSAVVFDMGGVSPLATVGASLIILTVLLMGGPIFAYLPEAVLAALIMSAVVGLVDIQAVWKFVRYSKSDATATLVSFAGVLFLGVRWGIAIGALTSLALFLWRTSRPRIVVEGEAHDEGPMRSAERHDVEDTERDVLVMRIDESLYFANARFCESRILELVARHRQVKKVVLDLKTVGHIDGSALNMLERVNETLKTAGLELCIAHARKPVEVRLRHIGFMQQLESSNAYESTRAAVEEESSS